MKKIVLSCVTCLLAVGLLAACNNDDKVEDDGEKDDGTVVEPVALEGTYYFGFEVEGKLNAITGDYLYNSEGSAYTYEGAYTSTLSDAVAISAEHIDSEYYLSFVYGGSTLWITTTVSSSGYTNLSYSSTKAPIYLHTSSTSEYFGTEDGLYFLCQNSTFKCLYLSDVESWMGSAPVAGLYSTSGELVLGGVGGPAYVPAEPAPVPTGESTVKIGVPDYSTATYYYLTAENNSSTNGIVLTDDWDKAAEFYVTSVDDNGGVTIGTVVDEEGWYLYYNSGKSTTALSIGNTLSCVWTWTIDEETGAISDPTSGRLIGLQKGYDVARAYVASNFTDNLYGTYFLATILESEPSALEELKPEEFNLVNTPTSAESYYFGYAVDTLVEDEQVESTSYYLFNGSTYNNYELRCSVGSYSAVQVVVTSDESQGWTLTYTLDETEYTIYAYVSTSTSDEGVTTTYYDLGAVETSKLSDTLATEGLIASSTFSWDSTNSGFTVTLGEDSDDGDGNDGDGSSAVTCYVSADVDYNEIGLTVLEDVEPIADDGEEDEAPAYAHLYTLTYSANHPELNTDGGDGGNDPD